MGEQGQWTDPTPGMIPDKASSSCRRFLEETHKLRSVKITLYHFAATLDNMCLELFKEPDFTHGRATMLANSHLDSLDGMLLCRIVDNLMSYVSELLGEMFTTCPDMLKNSESKLTFKEALEHPDRASLVSYLAERRVHDLSYQGFDVLCTKLENDYGLQVFANEADLRRAYVLVEQRNILTHNRGVVNRRYLSKVVECSLPVGERIDASKILSAHANSFVVEKVLEVDGRAVPKYKLGVVECSDIRRVSEALESTRLAALDAIDRLEDGRQLRSSGDEREAK